jgi:Tfp pilus assembly protein PilO
MTRFFRKDSLITVCGLALLAAGYYFGILRPGAKFASKIRRGIASAEQSVREIPQRVAELESLKKEIDRRESYLRGTQALIPQNADLHTVVREVTRLADRSRLKITRLEPLPHALHDSYLVIPFRASLLGDFQGLSQFLRGLETQDRLITINDLSIGLEDEKTGKTEKAEVYFAVYAIRGENSDFINKADSSAVSVADPKIR